MIQAGTISTGSAPTWASSGHTGSVRSTALRNTTLPGVQARSTPTMNPLSAGSPLAVFRSRRRLRSPAARLAPPLARVASITSGFSQGTLDGETVEPLAHGEGDDALVGLGDPAGIAHGLVRPFLAEQHRLDQPVVRSLLPRRTGEAMVVGLGRDGVLAADHGGGQPAPLGHRRAGERGRLKGRVRRMRGPVEQGQADGAGRAAAGEPALPVVQHAVQIGGRQSATHRRNFGGHVGLGPCFSALGTVEILALNDSSRCRVLAANRSTCSPSRRLL